MQSKITWVSLKERAPPSTAGRQLRGRYCWLLFKCESGAERLGLWLEGNKAWFRHGNQMELTLDEPTHWRPLDEALLQEFEVAATCGVD